MTRRELRIIAMTSLYQFLLLDTDPEVLFENNLKYNLPERFKLLETSNTHMIEDLNATNYHFKDKDDIRYIIEVVSEAINQMDEFVEWISKQLVNWSFDRLGYCERAILLLALAEFSLKTADRKIIIDEAVDLSKIYGDEDAYGLINGILDKYE